MSMETVVIVAIAILAVVFFSALIAMVILCRHKYCQRMDFISSQHSETRPEVNLINSQSGDNVMSEMDVELGEVTMNVSNLENLLENHQWIDDAAGVVPPCIHILKTCHQLTERMVAMAMNNSQYIRTQETFTEIVSLVKKIGPRVDEAVESLYPPLDPRLLEARCTALVLSVSHLVMITKHVCHQSGQLDWIDQSLADVEESLQLLRSVSLESNSQPESDRNLTHSNNFDNNRAFHNAGFRDNRIHSAHIHNNMYSSLNDSSQL